MWYLSPSDKCKWDFNVCMCKMEWSGIGIKDKEKNKRKIGRKRSGNRSSERVAEGEKERDNKEYG